MANANPGQSLTNQTTAANGTGVDLAGAATGVAVPTTIGMVVTVSGMTAGADARVAPAVAQVGLEVSLDNASWVRLGVVQCPGNGVFSLVRSFPSRYARGVLDTLDQRISGLSVNAWVAGGQ
jgi:hypothetical protein